ncbi:MAG: SdpI family protein [Candidatus Brocadiaceae bacterium]|nr:SdpI family protein [Candidatus Brocadiaceae bacterium]
MHYLPEETEQKHILEELLNLIKSNGAEPFLNWPIWEPTRDHLPHTFPQNGEGVWQICRILLDHIGLQHIRVKVSVIMEFDNEMISACVAYAKGSSHCEITVCESAMVVFGFLIATIAHEVTHVYRKYHDLELDGVSEIWLEEEREDDTEYELTSEDESLIEQEELLTDLTAMYLGFGVLLTKESERHFTSVTGFETERLSSTLGYLSPQAMCYILAVQAVLRGVTAPKEIPYITFFDGNQKAFFKRAFTKLFEERELFGDLLNTPVETVDFPIPQYVIPNGPSDVVYDSTTIEYEPESEDSYISRLNKAHRYGANTLVVSGIVAIIISRFTSVHPMWVLILSALYLITWLYGSKQSDYRCEECFNHMSPELEKCPKCNGVVAGVAVHTPFKSSYYDRQEYLDKFYNLDDEGKYHRLK